MTIYQEHLELVKTDLLTIINRNSSVILDNNIFSSKIVMGYDTTSITKLDDKIVLRELPGFSEYLEYIRFMNSLIKENSRVTTSQLVVNEFEEYLKIIRIRKTRSQGKGISQNLNDYEALETDLSSIRNELRIRGETTDRLRDYINDLSKIEKIIHFEDRIRKTLSREDLSLIALSFLYGNNTSVGMASSDSGIGIFLRKSFKLLKEIQYRGLKFNQMVINFYGIPEKNRFFNEGFNLLFATTQPYSHRTEFNEITLNRVRKILNLETVASQHQHQ